MRKVGVVCSLIFLSASLAFAQGSGSNIYGGFSYASVNSFGFAQGTRVSLTGWEASAEVKIFPHVGFVADVDDRNATPSLFVACPGGAMPTCIPQTVHIHQADVLFGPRVSISIGKFRPFAEGLVGLEHVSTDAFGPDRSLAEGLGGGVDYKLMRRVAARVEADYIRASMFRTTQNSARVSAGLVFRF